MRDQKGKLTLATHKECSHCETHSMLFNIKFAYFYFRYLPSAVIANSLVAYGLPKKCIAMAKVV